MLHYYLLPEERVGNERDWQADELAEQWTAAR